MFHSRIFSRSHISNYASSLRSRIARQQQLCSAPSPTPPSASSRFWKWTTEQRPDWKLDNKEKAVAFVVFGVTGTTSVTLIRPLLTDLLGIQGSMIDGPWSYRIGSLLLVSNMYAITLFTLGTLAGRHAFFGKMSFKILGRFFPKKFLEKVVCEPARVKIANSAKKL
jgi:hypothetical protein